MSLQLLHFLLGYVYDVDNKMADVGIPEIKILLLGDEKCGKSTFLS
jgi:GTPase SAR1 family protein